MLLQNFELTEQWFYTIQHFRGADLCGYTQKGNIYNPTFQEYGMMFLERFKLTEQRSCTIQHLEIWMFPNIYYLSS